jgi:uncharacterized protein (TIGR00297 family)
MLPAPNLLLFAAISAVFAAAGRLVRGVTISGGIAGAVVCFALLWAAGIGGFAALFTVFILTWACTKFGYAKKQRLGTAEKRSGRDAWQVVANLGIASACALAFLALREPRWLVAMGAALAEAAADTVSSEIGQAAGGEPRVVTSWTRVPVGTNGAVTVTGSAAGILAAAMVALVCYVTSIFGLRGGLVSASAGVAGMIGDSVLGATVERRQMMGNNGVNFVSTAIAATVALLL